MDVPPTNLAFTLWDPDHPVDPRELARLVWPLYPGAVIEHAERLPGRVNSNLRLSICGRERAVSIRFHGRGEWAARTEWDVLELVKGRVPVPLPLWIGVDPEWGPYTVRRWVDGISLHDLLRTAGPDDIAQAAAAVGCTLARIGSFPFRLAGFLGPGPNVVEPFDLLSRTVRGPIERALFRGHAARRLGKELTLRVWNFTMRHSRSLDGLADLACLVHGDFRPDNILLHRFDNGWAVTGVIDWEWAFSGSPLYDAGALLRHVTASHSAFESHFLNAFTANGGELPPNGSELARLFDLVNLLDAADHAPDDDPDLDAVLQAIARAVASEPVHGA